MKIERIVGSPVVRAATIILAALALVWGLISTRTPSVGHRWVVTAAIVCPVLALIFAIHSSHGVFTVWMRFAKVLNLIVTTVLFGVVYLVVVPPFALVMRMLDPLRLRRLSDSESLWHERQR